MDSSRKAVALMNGAKLGEKLAHFTTDLNDEVTPNLEFTNLLDKVPDYQVRT